MAAPYNITISKGETFQLLITVGGVDISSYTARGQARASHAVHSLNPIIATFTTAISYSAPDSTITISLTAAQTAALTAPQTGVYDVEYFLGSVVTRILEGAL